MLVSCTKGNEPSSQYYLPWPTSSGEDRLQVVNIATLNSPYKISGPVAQLYLSQGLEPGGYSGEPMQPRLTRVNDVFYPLDTDSAMGLALYAHMERIKKLDESLDIVKNVTWPRQIGIEVLLQELESRSLEYNNARYFVDWDVTAFMPMAKNDNTPLAINPGIIAHEHFHAHFNNLVSKKIGIVEKPTELEIFNEQVILRGWNEGLADYYGYVYSQNENFLEHSLGVEIGASRKLKNDKRPLRIKSAANIYEVFEMLRTSEMEAGGMGYSIGSEMARVLVQIVDAAKVEDMIRSHLGMMKHIFAKLPTVADAYIQQKDQSAVEPAALLKTLFFESEPVLSARQCAVVRSAAPILFQDLSEEDVCAP